MSSTDLTMYVDLEIRILKREAEGYPVEITLNHDQQYERGFLDPELPVGDGARLFRWLLADDVLREAWEHARGQHPQRRIRLRFDADAPELHALPWEALHDPDSDQNLAASDATPFSRYLAGMWQPGSPIPTRPVKILVAIANPIGLNRHGLAPLNEEAEWAALRAATGSLDEVTVTRLSDPCTLAALEAELRRGYHVLHLVAHGTYHKERRRAALYLSDETNHVTTVWEDDLARMLKRQLADGEVQDPDRLRLVFLASCESATRDTRDAFRGLAPALVDAGVPAVVAMQDRITITAAREFSGTFYKRLLQHGLVDLAGNQARAALLTVGSREAATPVVFMRMEDGRLWPPGLAVVNPYRGLAAFTEEDARRFFGREALTAELVERLRANPRFLAVIGPSGSGKSSVVRAGLIPALREGALYGSQDWHIVTLRPSDDVYAAFEGAGLPLSSVTDWPMEPRLMVLVDQFEELFALCAPEMQRQFLNDVQTLVEGAAPITFVLTLRADFYGRLLQHSIGEQLQAAQVNVLSMAANDLRAAIEGPAQQVYLEFEAGLVDAIVEDAGQAEHVLPLLQSALTQMCHQAVRGRLTYEAYQAVGRVTGALGVWAEDTYAQLGPDEQALARDVFTRLVHFGVGDAVDTRRRRSLVDLITRSGEREAVHHLVGQLANARLLVTTEDTVEIIHDALLREWGRLRRWLIEEREFYLWRQRLDERLGEREEKGQDVGVLLRGTLLAEAERWLMEQPGKLNEAERGYITESLALRERERAAREQRRRRFTLAAVGASVVFLILALLTWGQRNQAVGEANDRATAQAMAVSEAQARATAQAQAEEQRLEAEAAQATAQAEAAIARSREIAAVSIGQLDVDAELSLLLALEAVESSHTLQAEEALRQSLVESRVRAALYGNSGRGGRMIWNPVGTQLATLSSNNVIRIWDMTELTPTLNLGYTANSIRLITWSSNGRYIAAVFQDEEIWVWNVQTGEVVDTLAGYSVSDLAWGPQSRRLVFGGCDLEQMDDGKCLTEEVLTWEILQSQEPTVVGSVEPSNSVYSRSIWNVAWNPNGRYLAAGLNNGNVKVWDIAAGEEITVLDSSQPIITIAWSPDGKQLAVLDYGKLHVWDMETESIRYARVVHINSASSGMKVLAWSPDGENLAFRYQNHTIMIWNIGRGEDVLLSGNVVDIRALGWSHDSRSLASLSSDGVVRLWDASYGRSVIVLAEGMGYSVESVTWNPQGTWLAFDYYRLSLWNSVSGETRILPDSRPRRAVVWDPSGARVAFDVYDGPDYTIHGWDVVSQEELFVLDSQTSSVLDMAWSPDQSLLASVSGDGRLQIWQVASGDLVKTIEPPASGRHGNATGSVAWNAAGTVLAFSLQEPEMWLWDWQADEGISIDIPKERLVYDLAWSPGGTSIAIAASDVHIWDSATGAISVTLAVPYETAQGAQSVSWSPDGTRLACGYSDGAVRIWDVDTRRTVLNLTGHTASVRSLAWSPDGRRLASGSSDFTARVYYTGIQDLLEIARQQVSWQIHPNGHREQRRLTPEERYLYLGENASP